MTPYTIIALSLTALIIYLIVVVLLIKIRTSVKDGLQVSIGYIIASICVLIIIRAKDILEKANIFTISLPYIHESLVVLFSVLLLIGIFSFYRNISRFKREIRKQR